MSSPSGALRRSKRSLNALQGGKYRLKEDMKMRTFDLTPLYRTSIGFDRLASMLDDLTGYNSDAGGNYPPFNIELLDENKYRLTMAVAGFSRDEINIEVKENVLSIRGQKADEDKDSKYLHRGIATRNFERRFQLADHVYVKEAEMNNGLLHVELVRELPEAMKPRNIPIGKGKKDDAKLIEGEAAEKAS
jgi:molecular chaperone IbpA